MLLSHPRGLFYLAFTEGWERFSLYGMVALISLYMGNQLVLPGSVEHIAGFASLRAALERLSGPLSTQALASQIFGLYSGLVYFTPVLGGMVADRWIGQRNAVVIGAVAMAAGHAAMTFDRMFLVASSSSDPAFSTATSRHRSARGTRVTTNRGAPAASRCSRPRSTSAR